MGLRRDYVAEYYERNYRSVLHNGVDTETKLSGEFLATHVKGKTLDFGCGPSIQFNALFMPFATRIDGIDIVPENIAFARREIAHFRPEQYKVVEEYMRKSCKIKHYSALSQIKKIKRLIVADFTKALPPGLKKGSYDCVVSTYSIGCVRTMGEYKSAIQNLFDLLRSGGTMLCLNTDGQNRNAIIPEISYQGLAAGNESHDLLEHCAREIGFQRIVTQKKTIQQDADAMYKYSSLFFTSAKK